MPNHPNQNLPADNSVNQFQVNPPEVSIIGCGWLGFAVAQRLIQLDTRVAGSTTTTKKLAGLRSIGVDAALLRLDPPIDGESNSHHDSAPLKRLFAAPNLVITIPPGPLDETSHYVSALQELFMRWSPQTSAHLIFVSSTSVYGNANGKVDETTEADPTTTSAKLMRAAEIALMACCQKKNVKFSILRSAGQIGFGRHPGRFLADKTGVIDPELPVNLIHQVDLAECVVRLLRSADGTSIKSAEIYNAAARLHPARREFYEAATQTIQLRPPVFAPQDPARLPGKLISSEKICKTFAFEFQFDDLMAIARGRLG